MSLAPRSLKAKRRIAEDQAKNSLKQAWPALRLALTVFEKTLNGLPIPGVKGAVGGFLVLAKAEETSIQNSEDVLELQKHITKMTLIFKRWQGANELPLDFKRRATSFFSDLSTISKQLHDLTSRRAFYRFFTAEDDALKVSKLIRTIDHLVQQFQLDTVIAIEVAVDRDVHNIQETIRRETPTHIKALTDAIRHTNTDNPIASLPRAENACFNASTRQDESGCLEQTRVDLLSDINIWVKNFDKSAPWMFVLQGLAGTGKSTIAHTVCETITERGWLGASFFFSRNEASCSDPFLVFTTIAFQLASQYPEFKRCLTDVLKTNPDIVGWNLETQLEKLVIGPLHAAANAIGSSPVIVVIDALDECGDYRPQMMSLLCSMGSKLPICFKLFLSLRPEYDLVAALTSQSLGEGAHSFILHDVDASVVRGDIERFLRSRLLEVADKYPNIIDPRIWPSADDISALAEKSDKLFIFAATVVKLIEHTYDNPQDQLNVVLSATTNNAPSPYIHLDQLYQQVLESALPETAHEKLFERFRMVMGAVILLYDSLTLHSLGHLLQMEPRDIRMALLRLHSVIIVPDNENEIRLIHPSFRDFMTQRCPEGSRRYFINTAECHQQLALRCFKTMEDGLKKDICGIQDPGKLNREVGDLGDRISAFIPANLQYACRHWATHLSESSSAADCLENTAVDSLASFISLHLLHWLEVLSLIGCLGEALPAIRHAQLWASKSLQASTQLCELLSDGERFALEFFSPISLSALHIYQSALSFTPQNQLLRHVYQHEFGSVKVICGLPQCWNPWLFGLYGHLGSVASVMFSPDDCHIASGSYDKTVRIWDAKTGVLLTTLKGHSSQVESVAFSPDGNWIASGSFDRTVQIWDAKTGMQHMTLKGHLDSVMSVMFSPDGSHIASGSYDKTVQIWDAETGVNLRTLEGHLDWVLSVMFSPDGSHIASGSSDKTVQIWDVKTGVHLFTLEGHSNWVDSIAFSPDGNQIASGSYDNTIRIWNAKTGMQITTLKGHSDSVLSVVFSPDGSCIASGSSDNTVQIWDAKTGRCLTTLKGHSKPVESVIFSSDGNHIASGSYDKTVRIWDANIAKTGVGLATAKDHSNQVLSVAFSPDGSRIASGSSDKTVQIWDANTGMRLIPFKGHSNWVESVVFSPDGSQIASRSYDDTVQIWDTGTGQHLTTLKGHASWMNSLMFSPDGSHIASRSSGYSDAVQIWDAKTGVKLRAGSADYNQAAPDFSTSLDPVPTVKVYLTSSDTSPGWLLAKSGPNHTRLWIPAGLFSECYHHSSHGNSVVIGTDRGLLLIFEILDTTY